MVSINNLYRGLFICLFPPSSNHDHPESITPSLSDRDNEETVRPDRYPPTSRPLKRPASRRNDRSEDQLEESYRRQAAEILRPMNFKSTEEVCRLYSNSVVFASIN